MVSQPVSDLQMLFKGVRKGDFSALLALKDYCQEFGEEHTFGCTSRMLAKAEMFVLCNYKPRCGLSEMLRRWYREELMNMAKRAKWRGLGPQADTCWGWHPMNKKDSLLEWQMKLARAALAYYRELHDKVEVSPVDWDRGQIPIVEYSAGGDYDLATAHAERL